MRVNPEPPAYAELGPIELRTGVAEIVNVRVEEVPPPGVYTVTLAVPAVAISDARIEPCNWLELTYVVVRSVPFHRITEFVVKFEPLAIRMNPGPPGFAKLGDSELRLGMGVAEIVNVRAEEAPPLEVLYTITLAVPAVAISDARIEPCNWLELTYVVVRSEPFHRITEFVVKFEPVAVRMNPGPPAYAEVGEIEPRLEPIIVNVRAGEAPPPGVYTVTPAVPVVPISDARIEPCNCVESTYVVVRSDPFHRIVEFVAKFPP
jgi:hypothetical protein